LKVKNEKLSEITTTEKFLKLTINYKLPAGAEESDNLDFKIVKANKIDVSTILYLY
jgi:hypothetical protein